MLGLDLKRVAAFVRGADTEELLDRVTVYRNGMEPAALDLMEAELDRRGVTRSDIADHYISRRERANTRGNTGTTPNIRCQPQPRATAGRGQ